MHSVRHGLVWDEGGREARWEARGRLATQLFLLNPVPWARP